MALNLHHLPDVWTEVWWHCNDTLSLCQRRQRSLEPFHSQGFTSKKPLEIKLQTAQGGSSRAACVAARREAHTEPPEVAWGHWQCPSCSERFISSDCISSLLHQQIPKRLFSSQPWTAHGTHCNRWEKSTQHSHLEKGNKMDRDCLHPVFLEKVNEAVADPENTH